MKKHTRIAVLSAVVTALCLAFAACGDDQTHSPSDPPVYYTVTYDLNGGTGTTPAETDKEEGAKFTLALATGIANGDKTFAGWNDGTITYAAGAEYTMPKANVTLTAQWTDGVTPPADVKYTVTYDLNGGTGTTPTETDKEEGEKFILALATGITNGDKTFAGWNDGTITYAAGAEYTMPKANVTLTAQWESNSDPEDPDAPPEITEEVNAVILYDTEKYSGYIQLLESGDGYIEVMNKKSEIVFIQCEITYSIDSNGTFTVLTAPDSKLIVPAKGKVSGRKISITLQNKLGDVTSDYIFENVLSRVEITSNIDVIKSTAYYPVGYPIDLTNVDSQTEYELTGFKVDKTEDKTLEWGQNFVVPANNIAIKYIWSKIETVNYTVTYKAGDGVGEDYVDTAVHADYTLKYNTATNFTRTGYKFAGWTIGGVEYGTGAKVKLTGDTVVIARWNKVYTVSYANVDSSGINTNFDPDDTYYTEFTADRYFLPYGARPSMGSGTYFSRTGFTLRGWTSSSETTGTVHAPGEKYTLTEDTVFTAVWQSNATFDAYAGEYTSATGIVVDGTYNIKSVTMSGNKLKLNDDGTEREVELSMSDVAGTATGTLGFYSVTAVFDTNKVTITLKRLSTEYTAEFVKGGATTEYTVTLDENLGGEAIVVKVQAGGKVDKPTDPVHPSGKHFRYWRDADTKQEYDFNSPVTGNISLEAVYAWKLTFSAGEGTGTIEPVYVISGRVALPDATGLSCGSKTFVGWSNGETTYQPGDMIMPTTNVTFTAQWETPATNYTVTFIKSVKFSENRDAQGEIPTMPNKEQGEKITLPQNPFTLAGYSFVGWTVQEYAGWDTQSEQEIWNTVDTKNPGEEFTVGTKNIRIAATWQKDAPTTVTVTYKAGAHGTGADVVENNVSMGQYTLKNNTFAVDNFWTFFGWRLENGQYEEYEVLESPYNLTRNTVFVAYYVNECAVRANDSDCVLSLTFNEKYGGLMPDGTYDSYVEVTITSVVDNNVTIKIGSTTFTGTMVDNVLNMTITYGGATYTFGSGSTTTEPAQKYTVTYDLGGGTGALPTEADKAAGEKFNLAASTGLTNGDKTFDGWSDGTNKYDAGAQYTMPSSNVTLTAQWKDAAGGETTEYSTVNLKDMKGRYNGTTPIPVDNNGTEYISVEILYSSSLGYRVRFYKTTVATTGRAYEHDRVGDAVTDVIGDTFTATHSSSQQKITFAFIKNGESFDLVIISVQDKDNGTQYLEEPVVLTK